MDDDSAAEIEEATAEVCSRQLERQKAWLAVADLKEKIKEKTEVAKDIDAMFDRAAMRLRKLREGRFPDGDKYPLYDTAKAEIDEAFSPGAES